MLLIDLAKMAKIHKFGLANSLLDSPMATLLTLTGTLIPLYKCDHICMQLLMMVFIQFNHGGLSDGLPG